MGEIKVYKKTKEFREAKCMSLNELAIKMLIMAMEAYGTEAHN